MTLKKYKDLPFDDCEIKVDNKKGIFEGYASVFGGVDSYGDTIAPGAFKETLKNRKRPPHMFFSHNSYGVPIGKWLDLKEDDKGLFVRGEFTKDNPDAQKVKAAVVHGTIDGLSIGYRLEKGSFEIDEETEIRTLTQIDLIEISPTTMPSDDDARISGIKVEDIDAIETLKDFEYILRELGCSKKAATDLVSRLMKLSPREADSQLVEEITELKNKVVDYEAKEAMRVSFAKMNKLLTG